MKIPQNYNMQNYRFPTQGKNYISVPGEAFTTECERTHTHTHRETDTLGMYPSLPLHTHFVTHIDTRLNMFIRRQRFSVSVKS